jgi:zinc protease
MAEAIVHAVCVILSATKNLVLTVFPREILRCAQNDGVVRICKRLLGTRPSSCPFLTFPLLLLLVTLAGGAEQIFPYRCQKEVLPNGLTVLMIPMSGSGLVSYFSVVRVGSRNEVEPGHTGFAHFFEHIMFRGTKKRPGSVYDGIVAGLGAQANAYTSDDLTCYYLTFAKDDLETVIDVESDRFQNLSYGKQAFQTEAGAVYGEYRIGRSHPGFAIEEKLHNLAYDAHTYKHTTIGFEADVKAMPQGYDYSLSFYRRFYRPENVVILVVGDFDPKATLGLIEKYYGSWQRGYEPPKVVAEPPQTAPRSAEIAFPGRSLPILTVAYKGDAFDPANRDYVAARLLGELAFGPQSELYKKLVLREQKVESLGCHIPINRDPSLFEITAVVKRPEDVDSVYNEIRGTLNEFKTRPVDAAKLGDLKRRDRYAFLMSLDSPESVAGHLARFVGVTGGIEAIDELFAAEATVTPEEIMHAAKKYFVAERRTTVLLKGEGEKGKGEPKPLAISQDSPRSAAASPRREAEKEPTTIPQGQEPQVPDVLYQAPEVLPLDQCVLLPVKDDPTVSFRIWFTIGSQHDPAGKEGLAAITAAMIAEGATQSSSYEQVLDKLFPLAAGYGQSASTEMTVISARVHKDNLEKFYPLLIQAIREPAFKQEDLDRIKSQTLNYLENSLRYSSDEELSRAVLDNSLFAGTIYGHLPAGTVRNIRAITIDDVKQFYRDFYTTGNVVLGLGGGYDAALLDKLRRDLARITPGWYPELWPPEPKPLHGRRVTIVEKDCNATAISIGFPIDVRRGSKDWYALALANCWFGQHRNQNGRLYQVIREARGLNYGDYSYIEHYPNSGGWLVPPTNVCRRRQAFEIWIRPVPNATRHFVLRAALRELQKLVDRGLTEGEFREAQKFMSKFVLHLAPTTMDRLGYAIDDRFYGIKGSHVEKFRRAMNEVTLAEVNAAIKKHLQYKNLDIAIVTKDAESLKKALVEETPSPITYATPKPESVLAEDREIGVFPLRIKAENIRIVPVGELFKK